MLNDLSGTSGTAVLLVTLIKFALLWGVGGCEVLWTMIFIQGAVFRPRLQAIVRHPAMNVTQLLELEGLTMKLFYCETRKGSQKKFLISTETIHIWL